MLRDMAFVHFFGPSGLLDAWFIAFKIPNLSRRLFGEGAASASFIPVYSEQIHQDPEQAAALANTIVTFIFTLLAALVLLGWGGILVYYKLFETNPETRTVLSLTSIMLPYMIMICTVAILAGILHVHRHFATPAAAPIVLNISIIGTIVVTGWLLKIPDTQQVYAVATAVLIAGLVQIAIQVPSLRASGVSIRPQWKIKSEAFRKIALMMAPMIVGLTVTQINTLFDDLIAWWFSGSPEKGNTFIFMATEIKYPLYRGCVTHLNVAQRLYQLPLGVFGISLATAIFPVMSANAAQNDLHALKKIISRGIKGAVFVAIPAAAGLILVARPLVSALFEHGKFSGGDTKPTTWILWFYALGLCGFFAQQILTRAFYSVQDSKTPMRSALIAVFVNLVGNLTLIWFLSTAGLALSTAICSYLQVVILVFVLRRRFGGSLLGSLGQTIVKTVAATALMALVGVLILFMMRNLPAKGLYDVLRLIAVVPSAALIYILVSKILKNEMLSLFTGSRKK